MRRNSGTGGRGNMRAGLISLLTVVIVISLATAAVLAVSTSHAMSALAQRQANMTAEGYAAERSAQTLLAELDAELATAKKAGVRGKALLTRIEKSMNGLLADVCVEDVTATSSIQDHTLTCTYVTKEGRMLQTSLSIRDDATYDVVAWRLTAAPPEEENGDTLWSGSTAQE